MHRNVDKSLFALQTGNELVTSETLQWADGFILLYSITDRQSFNYIKRVKQQLMEHRNGGSNTLSVNSSGSGGNSPNSLNASISPTPLPMVLVANKADMVHLRQISTEEGT